MDGDIPGSPASFASRRQTGPVCSGALGMSQCLPMGDVFSIFILALLAIPGVGHAQGIVRGAQEGSYEGNRIAGPVGGVVGGAVGAGVGGAMGAVRGVFGIGDRGYRCRGYYDRYDHFHCYR